MSVPKSESPWWGTSYGVVWVGTKPATAEDIEEIIQQARDLTGNPDYELDIDDFSLVGTWDPWWTAKVHILGETTMPKRGGIGSHTYETQKVGEGVSFKDEVDAEIWHYDPDGNRVWGVINYPRTSRAYHLRDDDHGTSTWAGPEPGSEASDWLGDDGRYYWEEKYRFWAIDK